MSPVFLPSEGRISLQLQSLYSPRVIKVFKFLKLPPLSGGNYDSHITPCTPSHLFQGFVVHRRDCSSGAEGVGCVGF